MSMDCMMRASPHFSNVNIPRNILQTSTYCGSCGVMHMVSQTGQYPLAAPLGEIQFGLLSKFFSMRESFCKLESHSWYFIIVSAEGFQSCAFSSCLLQNPWFLRCLLSFPEYYFLGKVLVDRRPHREVGYHVKIFQQGGSHRS